MKKNNLFFKLFCIVLVVAVLASPATGKIEDDAARAVSRGIEAFVIAMTDGFFDASFSGYEQLDDSTGPVEMIYNLATWSPDPFAFPIVLDLIEFSKSLFTPLYSIILLAGFCSLLIVYMKPSAASHIKNVTGVDVGSGLHRFGGKAIEGLAISAFAYVFIFLILMINDILCKAVMIGVSDHYSADIDNFVLYFMMGIAYLGLSLLFGYRSLVIFLFTSFALLVGACYMIDATRQAAVSVSYYFVQVVFFQFINLIYFSAAILIIQSMNLPLPGQPILYLVMILASFYIAFKMLIGLNVIHGVIKIVT